MARSEDHLTRYATWFTLALGLCASVALGWPGHLSHDSVIQLLDGRTGRYHSWHPPFMAWLLGFSDAAGTGAGLFVLGQAGLAFGGLAVLVASAPRVRVWAPLAALALALVPQFAVWQAIVWKDVLFADLLLAGFALLTASARGAPGRDAVLLASGGMALLGAAALTRQNGLLAPLGGALAIGWSWATTPRGRAWAMAGVMLLATFAGVALAGAALQRRAIDGSGAQAQLLSLQAYDLAGALARDRSLPLTRLAPAVAAEMRAAAPRLYTPVRIDPLQGDPRFEHWTADPAALRAQWLELVRTRPDLWLRHRAAVFRWLVAPPDFGRCGAEAVGVDGEARDLAALGMRRHQSPRDLALANYAAGWRRTPLFQHAVYVAAALGLAGILGWRRRPQDRVVASLLLTALAFTASFAVIGVACDYRYLFALDMAVFAGAFLLALDPAAKRLRDATRPAV